MAPATIAGVVVFLLLAAPGTCYELLQGRHKLPREESTFVHVSRVILTGTWLSAVAAALLATVGLISPEAVIDVSTFIKNGHAYAAENPILIGWSTLLHLALSTLLAVLLSVLMLPKNSARIRPGTAWHGIAEVNKPDDTSAYLSIRVKNGLEFAGYYSGMSTDLDVTLREIIIRSPLSVKPVNGESFQSLSSEWQQMVIHGGEVESITASYVRKSKTEKSSTDPSRWNRVSTWCRQNYLTWQAATGAIVVLLLLVTLVPQYL